MSEVQNATRKENISYLLLNIETYLVPKKKGGPGRIRSETMFPASTKYVFPQAQFSKKFHDISKAYCIVKEAGCDLRGKTPLVRLFICFGCFFYEGP